MGLILATAALKPELSATDAAGNALREIGESSRPVFLLFFSHFPSQTAKINSEAEQEWKQQQRILLLVPTTRTPFCSTISSLSGTAAVRSSPVQCSLTFPCPLCLLALSTDEFLSKRTALTSGGPSRFGCRCGHLSFTLFILSFS